MQEQLYLDDRLDKFKSEHSAQRKKEKAELLRSYFKIPEKFSDQQILAKEKVLRREYQTTFKAKEEELGLVMGNIAESMLQQAFYGGDQTTFWSSQKQMANVLKAVNTEENKNTKDLKDFLETAKQQVVQKIFGSLN